MPDEDVPWEDGPTKPSSQNRSEDKSSEDKPIEYPSYLRGYGNQPLKRPRGFKGSKMGPASEGRKLSPEEIAAVEAQLKQDGKL
jgi:hypothetical protein